MTHHDAYHDPAAPFLDVRGLSFRFNGRTVLDDICFTIDKGERVSLVGPNGAGKSTLFKVIAGLLPAQEGEVRIAGHGPGRHICIAFLQQRSEVDWQFPVTVHDVVMMGRAARLGLFRRARRSDRERVRQCLDVVNLADLGDRQIGELSGGQQQRMFIARALAMEVELLLMDEPLTGLDHPAQERILEIMDCLKTQGITVMVATHDLGQAAEHFDRAMLMNGRLIGLGEPRSVFTTEHLKEAYGGYLQLIDTEQGMMVINDTCCEGGH